jgi:hypothetical protein
VTNHDLWLTHSRYSNDNEEMTHGYDITQKFIKEKINENRTNTSEPARIEYLEEVQSLLEKEVPEDVYICCFCQKGNLLSQWRSYGANGAGVSIRFAPTGFSYATGDREVPGGLMQLWKVTYEEFKQTQILQQAIDFGFERRKEQSDPKERARQAVDAIQFFIPTFKNEGFKEEVEYRLIFTPSSACKEEPQFRVAREMLVPYYSLKGLTRGFPESGGRLPIEGVRIGPSEQKNLNVVSAQLLLDGAGYQDVEVEASKISYRG